MPRNPNDAPSQVGQSSSSSEQQGQQQAQAPQPADINVAASSDSTVKAENAQATQVAASSMG